MCLLVCWKKKYEKIYFLASLKSLKKGVGSGSISQRCGSGNPDPGIRTGTKMSRIPNTAEHISENPNTISDGCQDRRNKSLLLFCALNYGREQIKSSQKTKNEKRLGDDTEGNTTWWFYGWRPVMDGWGGRRRGSFVSASRFLTRNWAKTSPT